MTSIHHKLFDMFKNLKADAMPRPPRQSQNPPPTDSRESQAEETENDENIDSNNEPEEIIVESDDDAPKKDKPKFKKSFFKPNKKEGKPGKEDKTGSSHVNTQATGNVINIVNSKNVRWGNDYYMGPTNKKTSNDNSKQSKHDEKTIEKNNLILLLLEAKIKPEHMFLIYISKNLGKDWHNFFRSLGFSKGAIETKEIDTASYGVSEARYKLLLDWMNDDNDGSRTLGCLSNILWEEGERELVHELSLLYKKTTKK